MVLHRHCNIRIFLLFIGILLLSVVIGFSSESRYRMVPGEALAQEREVKTSSGALISWIAPGEFLPISVKLVNFGGGRRVDVIITYQILDSEERIVVQETETVAVETTASYIKNIQIPYSLSSGRYIASSHIKYKDQEVPATSQFEFTVERKIAGIFVSQFIVYGIATLFVGIVFAILARLWFIHKPRSSRLPPHEYPNIPKPMRMFYEIISDTIMQMRSRVGDRAIELAQGIDGLVVAKETGKVLEVSKDPAKIIALIVLRYEETLGKKVNFALRKSGKEIKGRLVPVDKNLVVVRKYFQ